MDLQINYAAQPSGLIASAKTYSLIVKDGYLYGIHVGPAGNSVSVKDPLSAWAVNKVYERIARKVEEGMERLAQGDLEALAGEKHSFKVPLGQVTEAEMKPWGNGVRVKFRAAGRKFKLDIMDAQRPLVEQLLGQVQRKA